MARQKKPVHRVQMTEGKRNIIHTYKTYSVMNVRRSVRPKHCIKKWSWRYSCNGKVEFFTYT